MTTFVANDGSKIEYESMPSLLAIGEFLTFAIEERRREIVELLWVVEEEQHASDPTSPS